MRAVGVRLIAWPAIAWVAAGACFYFMQSALLFPAPKTLGNSTSGLLGLQFENLRIPVSATDSLHAATPSGSAILVFHGNGDALETMVWGELAGLHETVANLLAIDYRGYGSSSPATPSEITLNQDADAAVDWLLRRRNVPPRDLFVLGRSIGSGPATHIACNHPELGGLILESPFTSIDDAAATSWCFRIYPLSLMLRTHFNNLSKIASVRIPLPLISGSAAALTPPSMARQLFARAREPKLLHIVPGAAHNDLPDVGGQALIGVLQKFVLSRWPMRQ